MQQLGLHSNRLEGTVPAFSTLLQLQRLDLGNNTLSGTVPAFAPLTRLRELSLHNNLLNGTVPNFENCTALQQLNLEGNQLSGPLPPLASLSQLTVLRVARNHLTGSLPSSWRTLRALEVIDVSKNDLDGQILLFQPNELPPVSAVFVDLSHNRFGGIFIDLPPPQTINLTSLDIQGNPLLCPFPKFSLSLRILRSDCMNDWVLLGTYAGIVAGVAALCIAFYFYSKRLVSEELVRMVLFSIVWIVSAVSFVSDTLSYRAIVRFLQKRSGNCASINEKRVFFAQIYRGDVLPLPLQNVSGSYPFSSWIDPQVWADDPDAGSVLKAGLSLADYTAAFSSTCRQAPECAYDDALKQCFEARPDLATSGGGAHQGFLNVVIAFIAIRVAFELFGLIVTVVSYARESVVLRCRVWIKSSVFLPLLLVHAATRDELLEDVVLADTLPSEYIWELLTSGVFVAGLKLLAQTYYLLRVSQIGLLWPNWLSLLLGIVTVVRLVAQAIWSWRNEHLEKHYAERAESGVYFGVDDIIGGGGSVDLTDYARM
jgi:hypothetical protein